MAIKFGSIIVVIVALFIAKISVETTFSSTKTTGHDLKARTTRGPASIDEGYALYTHGSLKK